MQKYLSLFAAGLLAFSLPHPGWAQKEVAPPAVPPMLEGQRPLEQPETKSPAPPASTDEERGKAKVKGKSKKKGQSKASADKTDKTGKKKKTAAKSKKKTSKNGKAAKSAKKKTSPAPPAAEAVPDSI
jgi:hypothetical protein